MNLLFLVPKGIYDSKMSRVRFEEVEALTRGDYAYKHTVKISGPGWPDWPDGLQPIDYVRQIHDFYANDQRNQIHFVLSYMVEGLQGSPIKVGMIFHETYNRLQTLRKIRDTGATLVIFTYANDLAQYQEELEHEGRDLVLVPHSADPEIYKDYSGLSSEERMMPVGDPEDPRQPRSARLEPYGSPFDPEWKNIDVLIVGNLAQDFYPFRARLARLARKEIRKRGYNVVEAKHPGFNLPPRSGTFIGKDYAKLLNRSKLVLTCTGKHHYAFCKLVEIPLCWSLPVSDLPAERRGFFRQTMLNVEAWHTDREILYKIEEVLDDPEILQRLTTLAHDKVAQRLTMPLWAERFLYLVQRHVWEDHPEPPTPPVGEEDM